MNDKIFIIYQREDTAANAGRLYDCLTAHFGEDQVFIDVDQIKPGEDFGEVINRKIGACDIAIVVIGPNWLDATWSGKRRLDEEKDFVRMEIVAALQRNVRVIPVLVGGARMPGRHDLPEALAALSRRNAIELRESSFFTDVYRLIEAIEKSFAVVEKKAEPSETPGNGRQRATKKTAEPFETPGDGRQRAINEYVFVCYAREDEKFALGLAENLKKRGIPVWLDQWNISASSDWDRAIDEALRDCSHLLIVLSPASVESPEVRCELRMALDQKKSIIPVLYQPCEIPRRLRVVQFVDFSSRQPDDRTALEHTLAAFRSGGARL